MSSSLIDELISDFQTVSASTKTPVLGAFASCGDDRRPRVRTVIMHEISELGVLMIVSSYHKKWIQIEQNNAVELMVWWPELGTQYRLSGSCSELPRAIAKSKWSTLPEAARRLDTAYGPDFIPGEPIKSYDSIRLAVAERTKDASLIETPEHVRAIMLDIQELERLKISPTDRLHDRRSSKREGKAWQTTQLVP